MLVIVAWGLMIYRRLEIENRELLRREQVMREEYGRGQRHLEIAGVIDEWQSSGQRLGNSLATFLRHLPDSDRALLTQVQVNTESLDGQTVIRASGQAIDSDTVVELQQELIRAPEQYELHPEGIDSVGGNDTLPTAFSLEVMLPSTGVE